MEITRQPVSSTKENTKKPLPKLSLWGILQNDKGVAFFRKFVIREHSEEILDFVLDVEKFRRIGAKVTTLERQRKQALAHGDGTEDKAAMLENGAAREQLHLYGMGVWQRFRPGAPLSITWPADSLKRVQAQVKTRITEPSLFSDVQRVQIASLRGDVLPRFYGSREYAVLVEELHRDLARGIHRAENAGPRKDEVHGSPSLRVVPVSDDEAADAINWSENERLLAAFEAFFSNPLGLQLLQEHMRTEYSHDNLDFIVSVDEMRRRCLDNDEILKENKHLFALFMDERSHREVAVPARVKSHILARLETPDKNLFDDAYEVVLRTCRTDVFPRYVKSKAFRELLTELRTRYSPAPAAAPAPAPPADAPPSPAARAKETKTPAEELPSVRMEVILSDADLLRGLVSFCTREHSEENILFFLAVEHYRALADSPDDLYATARSIYDTYIESGSPFELAVDWHTKRSLREAIEAPSVDVFDAVQTDVRVQFLKDSVSRYAKSAEYAAVVRKRRAESATGLGKVLALCF